MRNIRAAGLEGWVVPLVSDSTAIGRYWPDDSLSLLFIDGGHSEEDAFGDYRTWGRCVRSGGYLCIHDVFTGDEEGGRAPYQVLCEARSTGDWRYEDKVGSLATLRRV